mgnify:CR=1 FL=1
MEDKGLDDIEWRVKALISFSLTICSVAISFLLSKSVDMLKNCFFLLFDYLGVYMVTLFVFFYFLITMTQKNLVAINSSKAIGWCYIISFVFGSTFIFYISSEVL